MKSHLEDHPAQTSLTPPIQFITVEEFTRHFKDIGKNTIYRLVHNKRIKSVRLGERNIRIPITELSDWPQREIDNAA